MREHEIREWLRSIEKSLGKAKNPVSEIELRKLYRAKNYPGMLSYVKKSMGLVTNLRIAYVNSGGPQKAPGWVGIPEQMPMFGSRAFSAYTFDVHVRKSFLAEASFGMVVALMAHELAHIVIASVGNEYRYVEPAVDLVAMHLGYRDIFRRYSETVDVTTEEIPLQRGWLGSIMDTLFGQSPSITRIYTERYSVGYLTQDEREYAAELMRIRSQK